MIASAALDVWNERELRQELLRIALSRRGEERQAFYAQAWALITRLRAGQSPEYYLARVITGLCSSKVRHSVV